MAKRNYDNAFNVNEKETKFRSKYESTKKHTLESDEEEEVDEDNILDADDIEGEEDGVDRQDGEQKLTAFNMKEEMEEGHFDRDGHFIWNNEKEIRDSWLDNIDWQKIKTNAESDKKYSVYDKGLGAESDSDEDMEQSKFDEVSSYKSMLQYMKPKESVNKAIKRLAGADMKLSSVERLKRKKAGTLTDSKDVTNLTEIANQILTNVGNMDVYQETFEQITEKVQRAEKGKESQSKTTELDMYADDFDEKEKSKIAHSTSKIEDNKPQLTWEFKWKIDDEKIEGPYTTAQMVKFSQEKHFKTGVMVRKCGDSSNFYSSNRIDFELYE